MSVQIRIIRWILHISEKFVRRISTVKEPHYEHGAKSTAVHAKRNGEVPKRLLKSGSSGMSREKGVKYRKKCRLVKTFGNNYRTKRERSQPAPFYGNQRAK